MVKLCKPYLPDKSISCWLNPLSTKFQGNTLIQYFNEGKFFTSATTLSANSFNGCSNLLEVDLRHVTSGITGTNAIFQNCDSLYKVVLTNITTIGYNGAINMSRSNFVYCSSLRRMVLPSLVNYRMLSQASGAPSLSMVDIGPGQTTLGYNSTSYTYRVYGFAATTQLIVRAITPPALGHNNNISGLTKIYVPSNSVEDYKAATNWNSRASYIFAIGGAEWVAEFGSSDPYANLTAQEYADTYGWLEEQG